MDNVVSIVGTRENELEFDISIQNVQYSDAAVRFVIEAAPIHYSFPCQHQGDDKWTVTVPKLSELKQTEHPFRFEVIVDGYYFEPHRGNVKVISEPEVKGSGLQSSPKAPVVGAVSVRDGSNSKQNGEPKKSPPAKPTKKAEQPKSKPKPKTESVETEYVDLDPPAVEPDEFANLAQQFLEHNSAKRTEKKDIPEKDLRAQQIIREFRDGTHNKPKLGDVMEDQEPPEAETLVRNIFRSVRRLKE